MKNNFIAFLFVGASADLARVMVGQLFSSCGEQVKMQKTGCPLPKQKKANTTQTKTKHATETKKTSRTKRNREAALSELERPS